MRKIEFSLLGILIVTAFFVRLYRIDSPIADWHSWRQADTSAVSRNFLKSGFDLLHPRFDDLSNVPSGKDNPQGYRFVEFPLYNAVSAFITKTFRIFPLEIWERLISILASLGSMVFLYLLVKKYLGRKIAFISAFFFAALPFNIYFSRVIMPEPSTIFASLAMIYFFDKWLEEKNRNLSFVYYFLALFSAIAAFLLKPYALFFLPPMAYLVWQKKGIKLFLNPPLYLFIILSLFPLLWWRKWMLQFPQGIPASDWLFNADNIRFKGAFFYWIFADRIGRLIFGYFGTVFFLLGLAVKRGEKEGWFFDIWLLSVLAYFFVIAGGNVRHDYYQVLSIPILCVFLAKGVDFFWSSPKQFFNRRISYLLVIISLVLMLGFSWYHVRDYFNINHREIVDAGQAVDRLVPKAAKVIAPYGGDTSFLYQTNRQGWPVGFEIEDKIKKGAGYYVNTNISDLETDYVMKKYTVLVKTDSYVIVKLQKR